KDMCSSTSTDTRIVLQDGAGKSSMCFLNPNKKRIKRTRIDDCMITHGKRCDWLITDHNGTDYYIELKGKKVRYASEQIVATIEQLDTTPNRSKYSFIIV